MAANNVGASSSSKYPVSFFSPECAPQKKIYDLRVLLKQYKKDLHQMSGLNLYYVQFDEKVKHLIKVLIRVMVEFNGSAKLDKLLDDFSADLSSEYPHDELVSNIASLREFIKFNESLSDDERTIIQTFKCPSKLQDLSSFMRQAVHDYAVGAIFKAKQKKHMPINVKELLRFLKIAKEYNAKKYLVKNTTKFESIDPRVRNVHLAENLHELIKRVPAGTPEMLKDEFIEQATLFIKQCEPNFVPQELNKLPAYHGDALDFGISELNRLTNDSTANKQTLVRFASDYASNKLKRGQYLLRPSSRATQEKDKFTFTISFRNGDNKLYHQRATRAMTQSGQVNWSLVTKEGSFSSSTFDSLDSLLQNNFESYQAVDAPSQEEMSSYLQKSLAASTPDASLSFTSQRF